MDTWIGFDTREPEAFAVAEATCLRHGGHPKALKLETLQRQRLLTRPMVRRGTQLWDSVSDAPCSTEFAISRFVVPVLQHTGWCLFVDGDVVFLRDLKELWALRDDRYAVMVVKHQHNPVDGTKMDGQAQVAYPRKNWSSVMLINCDHPGIQYVTLGLVNNWRGRDLHAFAFLKDEEIGELPAEWNWLVGVQPKPENPAIAHFTLGGPFIPGWKGATHDELWTDEHQRYFPAQHRHATDR
jgi:lipopolysaccharide biosynthesis glycosyltransferase